MYVLIHLSRASTFFFYYGSTYGEGTTSNTHWAICLYFFFFLREHRVSPCILQVTLSGSAGYHFCSFSSEHAVLSFSLLQN